MTARDRLDPEYVRLLEKFDVDVEAYVKAYPFSLSLGQVVGLYRGQTSIHEADPLVEEVQGALTELRKQPMRRGWRVITK